LKAKEINEEDINDIISPLEEIQFLRSNFSAHLSGKKADRIRKQLIAQHGNLNNHFLNLIERVDKSINKLLNISFE